MGCQALNLNPQFLHTYSTPKRPNLKPLKTTSFSSLNNNQRLSSTTIIPKTQAYNVNFKTLGACKLGISRYPDFEYDAAGGTGSGTATPAGPDGRVSVEFDVKQLYIPPLSTATTKFLGLPLPPFLRIDIVPEAFRGEINQEYGEVDIEDKMRENRLRWFGHVRRRGESAAVRKVEGWTHEEEKRGRGRPKLTWRTGVLQDMQNLDLRLELVGDRNEWRRRIHVEELKT